MDAAHIEEVSVLLHDAWRADGARPLNDHLWLDLREGGRRGFAGIVARDTGHAHPIGYCQVSRGNQSWSLDLVIHPHHRYDSLEIAPELLRAAVEVVADEGGGHVHWWVFEANNIHHRLAAEVGFRHGRRLLQMRRPLPLPEAELARIEEFEVTRFRPGTDEDAWLAVNNAAFADHPEQGAWTRDTIESRQREPWFEPAGFLLHWSGDRLDGFCWTKVHVDTDPPMGEIYVIGVDPDRRGTGLGRRMAVAGLHHLASRGLSMAMLYVDADNHSAMAMYEAMGFIAHHEEHAFVGDVAARPGTTGT